MALFLSHDVDQIHDRGLYRTLADLNHVRRVLSGREAGHAAAALRRVGRSIFRPKEPSRQFETILRIEAAFGWRSTFFFLEGARWSRYGARYRLGDPRVAEIARLILAAGCEIGVHGGWHDLDSPAGYRRSLLRVAEAFETNPVGIRNHYLRSSGQTTWWAQRQAGFEYDASFGWSDRPGFRDGKTSPFEPENVATRQPLGLVVLPLAVMDTTLFRYMRLGQEAAIRKVERIADEAEAAGGVLSLLWHNNFFDEPEYSEWAETYRIVLEGLAARRPWCATGAEIVAWWKRSGRSTGRQE